jgi:cell division protein FtsQ
MRAAVARAAAAAAGARPRGRRGRRLRRLLAALSVVPLCGIVVLARLPAAQTALTAAESRALAASASLGLIVGDVEVVGRNTTKPSTILGALGAERGTPILAVDLERARRQLESLPWVRSATIERRLPQTLFVRLVERQPLAVWQHDGRQELIDAEGEAIAVKDLSRFSELPTVVGADAAKHAAALLAMLGQQPDLARRVTAAVRVDDRRWNLRIDRRVEVLLPEDNAAAAAWARLADLDRTQQLLKRDVEAVDMRLPDRLVLRVATSPTKEAAPAKKAKKAAAVAADRT